MQHESRGQGRTGKRSGRSRRPLLCVTQLAAEGRLRQNYLPGRRGGQAPPAWHQQGAVTCHHSAQADWPRVDIFQEYSAALSLITLGGTLADLSS